MERLNFYGNKLLDHVPGFIFGLIALFIGLIGDFLAMYPGYSITKDMVSTLGVGPGAIYFNLGTFYSGLIAIPFYIDLGRLLRNESESNNERLIKIAVTCAIISCVSSAFIGVFPANQDIILDIVLHYFTALISWLTGVIYCVLFSSLMLRTSTFPKILAYLGFIPGSIIMIYLVLISIPPAYIITPIVEWSIVFSIISYIGINSFYMIYRKI